MPQQEVCNTSGRCERNDSWLPFSNLQQKPLSPRRQPRLWYLFLTVSLHSEVLSMIFEYFIQIMLRGCISCHRLSPVTEKSTRDQCKATCLFQLFRDTRIQMSFCLFWELNKIGPVSTGKGMFSPGRLFHFWLKIFNKCHFVKENYNIYENSKEERNLPLKQGTPVKI